MKYRLWIFASACLLALVIAGVTLMVGSSEKKVAAPKSTQLKPIQPDLPIIKNLKAPADPMMLIKQTQGIHVSGFNQRHQKMAFYAHRTEPVGDDLIQVTQPRILMHQKAGKLIAIRADQGQIVAQDRLMSRGTLQGHVVINLYNPPHKAGAVDPGSSDHSTTPAPGSTPDATRDTTPGVTHDAMPGPTRNAAPDAMPDAASASTQGQAEDWVDQVDQQLASRTVHMRIEIGEASFDNELGVLRSQDDVTVTGDRFEFVGRGLVLYYNERHSRIDRMEIAQGDYIRFYRLKSQAAKTNAPNTNQPSQTTEAKSDGPSLGSPGQANNQADYYDVVFQHDVKITGSSIQEMTADALTVVFSPDGSFQQTGNTNELSDAGHANPASPVTPWHQLDLEALKEQGLLDVIQVQWSGKVVMTPRDPPPAQLAGPDDMLLHFTGRPVRMNSVNQQSVVAADLQFYLQTQQLFLQGSDTFPIFISTPQLQKLAVNQIKLHGLDLQGDLLGPGILHTTQGWRNTTTTEPNPANVPESDLHVTWTQRVHFTVYPPMASKNASQENNNPIQNQQATSSSIASTLGSFDALRSVELFGDVHVQANQMKLQSQNLGMNFYQPANGKQALRSVLAQGDVQGQTFGQDAMAFQAGQVQIDMQKDATGQSFPSQLLATESVLHQTQDFKLTAQRVDAKLVRNGENDLTWEQLQADDQVKIVFTDQDQKTFFITAHKILASRTVLGHEQFEIFGSSAPAPGSTPTPPANHGHPATIVRDDVTLTGGWIQLDKHAQTMHVTGPGQFVVKQAPTTNAQGKTVPGNTMVVSWTNQMTYNHLTGKADFAGNVVALSQLEDDHVKLTSDKLQLFLVDAVAENQLASSGKTVQGLVADGQVVFLHRHWDTKKGTGVFVSKKTPVPLSASNAQEKGSGLFNAKDKTKSPDPFSSTTSEEEMADDDMPARRPDTRLRIAGPKMVFENRVHADGKRVQQIRFPGQGNMQYEDYRAPAPGPPNKTSEQDLLKPKGRQSVTSSPTASTNDLLQLSGQGITTFTWQGKMVLDIIENDMRLYEDVWMNHQPMDAKKQAMQIASDRFVADLVAGDGMQSWFGAQAVEPTLVSVTADQRLVVWYGDMSIESHELKYTDINHFIVITPQPGYTTKIATTKEVQYQPGPIRIDMNRGRVHLQGAGVGRRGAQ